MNIDLDLVRGLKTPLYWYDLDILNRTLGEIRKCIEGRPIVLHYAVKANANPRLLKIIADAGFGADCVSGREITNAIKAGFRPESICYAGVGKTDREILTGFNSHIGFFNVESIEELEVIDELARTHGCKPDIALRVNPNIDAHTHHYITTGLEENKFGIDLRLLDKAVEFASASENLNLVGLHFHIGSQITIMEPFKILCERINSLLAEYRKKGVEFKIIDVGGGLGVDYDDPEANPLPDFKAYFDTLMDNLQLTEGQTIHCELGRAVIAQCCALVSQVTYVKQGIDRKFVILDAGMNDLIRPALYGARHYIKNLSATQRNDGDEELYDVVGPICESSDEFGKDVRLPITRRGDILAIMSAGAYGESMASTYNARPLPESIIR